jgi:HTH-type transcriptional regulator, transcriptional repressor of NAD biosynthesis genes
LGRRVCDELGGCDGILLLEDYQRIAYGQKMLENQTTREENHLEIFQLLKAHGIKYHVISGNYSDRHNKVIELVNSLIN